MKLALPILGFVAGILVTLLLAGCHSPETITRCLTDGIYQLDEHSKARVAALDPDGNMIPVPVTEYTGFVPTRIISASLLPDEDCVQIQIDGDCSDPGWTKLSLLVLVDGVPYLEMSKFGGSAMSAGETFKGPGAITFKVKPADAIRVAERLAARYNIRVLR